jgi:N6-adenosine-specific RNA methylase IME4
LLELKDISEVAKLAGVNPRSIAKVITLEAERPDLAAEVRAGKLSLTEASRLLKKAATIEAAKLPSDKYRVIYADPPWQYRSPRPQYAGATRYHYPTLSLQELCNLPVRDLAEDNAVLFLWTTSGMLFDCAPVIDAWSFSYKSSFVWDKGRPNWGYYNDVRHELLLVCTRGSCRPDIDKLLPSVVSLKPRAHSEKPEEFRAIIDKLYPWGRRIELFARKRVGNWEAWGNAPGLGDAA